MRQAKWVDIVRRTVAASVGLLYAIAAHADTANDAKPSTPTQVNLPNPLGATDIPTIFGGRIIAPVLGVVGSLTLLMFVYGGFLWLTSGGSPDKIKKGRDVLMWATIGLLVIFGSYVFLKFVIGALQE